MAWRLARSIERLIAEIEQVAPGTRVGTIGDEYHEPPSRHLPGPEDRVRAADVHDNAGLDLDAFVDTLTTDPHAALTYLIYRDRAWSPTRGWHDYHGDWHGHVHVAVSDDQADNTSPWGVAGTTGGGDPLLGLSKGASGDEVETLQLVILDAGGDLPEFGADRKYGDETAEALRQVRESVGSDAEEGWGDTVTPHAYAQLWRAHAREQGGGGGDRGPRGKRGPEGPQGEPGEPGKTPTRIAITGEVIEAE